MRIYNMLGQKLFTEKEDGSIHMLRIVGMRKPFKITENTKDPSEITVYDYETKERKKVRVADLSKYHPLEPDGILAVSSVWVRNEKGAITKDVIVTATKYLTIKLKISQIPFAACRQSITDIWYNLFINDESQMMVGLSVNQNNCPTNFDYRLMFACDQIEYSDFINFYRTDTLDDLYSMMDLNKFDTVLNDLYKRHVKASKNPSLAFKSHDKGWCKDLKTLLSQNNFQHDINEMLDITQVDFTVSDFLVGKEVSTTKIVDGKPETKDIKYQIARDDFRYWLSMQYKENISEAVFVEYDHDINLGDYQNNKYLLIRDMMNKLYLVVYTVAGQYFEKDLEEKSKEMDFSTKFRLDFYNKYNNRNNK